MAASRSPTTTGHTQKNCEPSDLQRLQEAVPLVLAAHDGQTGPRLAQRGRHLFVQHHAIDGEIALGAHGEQAAMPLGIGVDQRHAHIARLRDAADQRQHAVDDVFEFTAGMSSVSISASARGGLALALDDVGRPVECIDDLQQFRAGARIQLDRRASLRQLHQRTPQLAQRRQVAGRRDGAGDQGQRHRQRAQWQIGADGSAVKNVDSRTDRRRGNDRELRAGHAWHIRSAATEPIQAARPSCQPTGRAPASRRALRHARCTNRSESVAEFSSVPRQHSSLGIQAQQLEPRTRIARRFPQPVPAQFRPPAVAACRRQRTCRARNRRGSPAASVDANSTDRPACSDLELACGQLELTRPCLSQCHCCPST